MRPGIVQSLLTGAAGVFLATPPPGPAVNVTNDVVRSWMDPAFYAGAAYCNPKAITAWNCGYACTAIAQPEILVTGGNNHLFPRYFVAWNGTHTIISIAGTNPWSILSIGNDLDFHKVSVDEKYFPASEGVEIHHGFYRTFKKTIDPINEAVAEQVLKGRNDVVVIGHSLGGAIGIMTSVFLVKHFPDIRVTGRFFGIPRVGNKDWADYADEAMGVYSQHMVNYVDVIPQMPAEDWGYRQSSGEIWIADDNGKQYLECPGQENPNCQDGLGLKGHIYGIIHYLALDDHLGPYAGVWISSLLCKK